MFERIVALLFGIGALTSGAGPCTNASDTSCQFHLAFGRSRNEFRISWVSVETPNDRPGVFYATSTTTSQPTKLSKFANASTETYTIHSMCDADYIAIRGWEDPGSIHHCSITLHESDNFFWYAVGDAISGPQSDTFGPVKARPGSGGAATAIAMFGDMGTYSYAPTPASGSASSPFHSSTTVVGAVDNIVAAALGRAASNLDAVVHVGDIVYANDGPQSRFRYWFDEVQSTMRTTPYMVSCGNHDCLYFNNPHGPTWSGSILTAGTDGGQCGVPHSVRFAMPGDPTLIQGWPEANFSAPPGAFLPRNNIFYSFDVGSIHVALVSSEHDLSQGSEQIKWLDADLQKVNTTTSPFIVVGLHRPLYISTKQGIDLPETLGMRKSIEPLLLKHKVHLVVAGHYHQYERTCKVAGERCSAQGQAGAVHITAGIGGLTHSANWTATPPPWSVFRSNTNYGFVVLSAVNSTHLKVDAMDANTNTSFDQTWILSA